MENYDKVFYNEHKGNDSILYVKVSNQGITYYVEQATDKYGNENLLVNKQIIKTGINDIPSNYLKAINKKEGKAKFLADLNKIHREYAQSVVGFPSDDILPQQSGIVNNESAETKPKVPVSTEATQNIEKTTPKVIETAPPSTEGTEIVKKPAESVTKTPESVTKTPESVKPVETQTIEQPTESVQPVENVPVAENATTENIQSVSQPVENSQNTGGNVQADFSEYNRGNGYYGYSMSNNAVSAYESGEKPLSKWTKADVLEYVKENYPEKYDLVSSLTLKQIKDNLLSRTSWHHTSKMYNKTDFYSIDDNVIESLDEDTVKKFKVPKAKVNSNKFKGDIEYLTWEGTKKHPKAVKHKLENVNIEEKGSFYIVTDEQGKEILRKKIGSNGTNVTNYDEIARRKKAQAKAQAEEKKRVRENSSASAYRFYNELMKNGASYSESGNICQLGRKPTSWDYEKGLENFFKKNEKRLTPNEYGGYDLEKWDGKQWNKVDSLTQKAETLSDVENNKDYNQKITVDMSDDARAEVLNKKSVNVVSFDPQKAKALVNINLDALQTDYKRHAKPIIEKVAKDFGILNKTYYNPDIEINFEYSNNSLKESINKQDAMYGDFAKMLSVFPDVIENAVGIETHNDKYIGTQREDTNLKQMYVLVSTFRDGTEIIPIKLEVKEFNNDLNKLYLSVVLTKKGSQYLNGTLGQNQLITAPPTSNISIADLVSVVNPSEGDFLKYFPDSMLDSEQIESKKKALIKEKEKIESYKKSEATKPKLPIAEKKSPKLPKKSTNSDVQADFKDETENDRWTTTKTQDNKQKKITSPKEIIKYLEKELGVPINRSNILYVEPNKKRTNNWLRGYSAPIAFRR